MEGNPVSPETGFLSYLPHSINTGLLVTSM